MNATEGTTVIGKSVKILGDLSGSEDLLLDGELQGTIQLPGTRLTIGASARCRASILAHDVIVYGKLEGDIRAKGRVELRNACMVQGSIFAGSFSMEDGAAFRGNIDPSRSEEPLPASVEATPAATGPTPLPLRPVSHLPAALAAVAARPVGGSPEASEEPIAGVGLFSEK